MKHYESTLAQITDQLYLATSVDEAKSIMQAHIESTHIREKDKKKMILELSHLTTLVKVQQYFTNALLRFEGLSVNSYSKET